MGIFNVYLDGILQAGDTGYLEGEMAFPSFQSISKSSGVSIYEITSDENATVPYAITDGNMIINDVTHMTIESATGKLIYKQGSILKKQSNIVSVVAYNPATREITLNAEPKVDFKINFLTMYRREDTPEGKYLMGSNILNVSQMEDVNDSVNDTKKTKENAGVETKTVASYNISEYKGVRYCYVVDDGANLRTGEILVISDGVTLNHTEVATGDIGDTSTIDFDVVINGSEIELQVISSSAGWAVTIRQDTI